MKLKYRFAITDMGKQKIAVAVGEGAESFRGFLKLNDAGASILEKLLDGMSFPELLSQMEREYPEESPEYVTAVVRDFLERLAAAGLAE